MSSFYMTKIDGTILPTMYGHVPNSFDYFGDEDNAMRVGSKYADEHQIMSPEMTFDVVEVYENGTQIVIGDFKLYQTFPEDDQNTTIKLKCVRSCKKLE